MRVLLPLSSWSSSLRETEKQKSPKGLWKEAEKKNDSSKNIQKITEQNKKIMHFWQQSVKMSSSSSSSFSLRPSSLQWPSVAFAFFNLDALQAHHYWGPWHRLFFHLLVFSVIFVKVEICFFVLLIVVFVVRFARKY